MADEIRRLIRIRTLKGARFKRDGFGKKSQISDSWRKPRGQHNKQREQRKAKGALPKPGFGSPVGVRGMHPSGFFEVLVHTSEDLEGLDPRTQSIRISGNVGSRKRAVIQEKALAAGLRVLNAKAVKPVKKPSVAEKESPKTTEKQESEKKKKAASEKKTKPKASPKKQAGTAKKAARKEEGTPVTRGKPEITEPEATEKPSAKKEKKKTAEKPVKEAMTGIKNKKTAKAKDEAAGDAKPARKTTAKPKKKNVKEGEAQ